jgi:DnaJ-class molecular chaperone
VIKEVKILEVHVDKGMKHGQRITFTGEADQAPGVEPGDIVLLLQEKEHEVISFLLLSYYYFAFGFIQNLVLLVRN